MAAPILNQPHFQDEHKAREYLEALRWADGVVCPHCGSANKHYQLQGTAHRAGLWKCKDCREQFSVTVGTLFERSKVKLHIWLQAAHFMSSSKNGVSSKELQRLLGVAYQTAWFMSHRLREAMKPDGGGLLGKGGGIVEADETYVGGKEANKHASKKLRQGRGGHTKEKVFSLVERDGKVRSFHVPDVTASTLKGVLLSQVSIDANLMTDEAKMYKKVGGEFATHGVVTHSIGEYVRGTIHTNTIEGFFSRLKRGLTGTYHHVGAQHLKRYACEFDFRYNTRQLSDIDRSKELLGGIAGKRLMYSHTLP